MKRSHFIVQAGLTTIGARLGAGQSSKVASWPIVVFEKPIQTLDYDRMGEELAKMGVQGIEATIRRGGHIEPKDAEAEVPKMVKSLGKNGQKALIATCNVNSASAKNADFLRILKANGIIRYRMDYFRYDLTKDLLPQVAENTTKLEEIEAMNREIGVQALYQIHAGAKYAGSLAWDAAMMFKKRRSSSRCDCLRPSSCQSGGRLVFSNGSSRDGKARPINFCERRHLEREANGKH